MLAINRLPKIPDPIPIYKEPEQKEDWKKIIRKTANGIKDYKYDKNDITRKVELNNVMINKRVDVANKYIEKVIDRAKNLPDCKDESRYSLGEVWLYLNFAPMGNYNRIEKDFGLLFSAAIWVLDQITEQPDWEEKLYPILPTDFSLLDKVNAPDVWDATYDTDLILSVAYVLSYRDGDINNDKNVDKPFFTNQFNALGNQHVDAPSRNAYEALISLIPKEAIDKATKDFEDLFWKWTDRYFSCIMQINKKCCNLREELNHIARRHNVLRDKLNEKLLEIDADRKKMNQIKKQSKGNVIRPIMSKPVDISTIVNPLGENIIGDKNKHVSDVLYFSDDRVKSVYDYSRQLYDICMEYNRISEKYNANEEDRAAFIVLMHHNGYIESHDCEDAFGPEIAKRMKIFNIANPYEYCFALLWLIENGSDLPWMYGPGCCMMQEVAYNLPWGFSEYYEDEDDLWCEDKRSEDAIEDNHNQSSDKNSSSGAENDPTDKKNNKVEPYKPFRAPDLYIRKYMSDQTADDNNFVCERSFAQILYEQTGCIIPRNLDKYSERMEKVKSYGVKNKKDLTTFALLFNSLSNARRQIEAYNLEVDDEDDFDDSSAFDYDELSERLKVLQEENKRLKSSIHESERATRDAIKELDSVRSVAEMDRRELADLRDIVFNHQMDDMEPEIEQNSEQVDQTQFPYDVKKNTVIFGGHDSWVKAIRPMLTGNVRFVEKENRNFDLNIVRNADILWIQTNALSHSHFERLMDAARTYQVPIRYFTYASAAKGAEQIMASDC